MIREGLHCARSDPRAVLALIIELSIPRHTLTDWNRTMARSRHAAYTAADRFERRATRRQTPRRRRQSTRRAIVLAALKEA